MENKNTLKEILDFVIYIAVVMAIAALLVTFVVQRTTVNGHSMEATLSDGDNLLMDKLSYRFKDPERFDIIVFPYAGEENTHFIKRIIGLPGETVRIDYEGNIYINGEILDEDYGLETIVNPGIAVDEITLGEDEYFVLGDNRNNSKDSRFEDVGNIKRDDIIGKVFVRFYPFSDFGLVKNLGQD